uniref:Uncharacterized protein n=1 Tax=viral metagenome TaxID=1070528 RepID=A0A6C0JEG4_9ZZZZ
MPFRALTHNRVKHYVNDKNGNTFTPQSQSQASAINSQNAVSNNGSVTSVRNKLNISNNNPPLKWGRVNCSSKASFLMRTDAYGAGTKIIAGEKYSTYAPGQGKGFPNATPQISVGSTNAFARRAIARRAVTTLNNTGEMKNCVCVPKPVKNLKGVFHK